MKVKVKGKLLAKHSPLNLWTKVYAQFIQAKYFPTNFVDYSENSFLPIEYQMEWTKKSASMETL